MPDREPICKKTKFLYKSMIVQFYLKFEYLSAVWNDGMVNLSIPLLSSCQWTMPLKLYFLHRSGNSRYFYLQLFRAPLGTNKFTHWSKSIAVPSAIVELLLKLCQSERDMTLNLFQRAHTLSECENDLSAWGGSGICHWLKQALFFTPLSNVT